MVFSVIRNQMDIAGLLSIRMFKPQKNDEQPDGPLICLIAHQED